MIQPTRRNDGTCSACIGGWQCRYHQQQGLRDDYRQAEAIRAASLAAQAQQINRVKARHEFESDEFLTADEKALA